MIITCQKCGNKFEKVNGRLILIKGKVKCEHCKQWDYLFGEKANGFWANLKRFYATKHPIQ